MGIHDKSNLLFNHYSSINLNYYLPNQRNNILINHPFNCNFNKINPTYNGKMQPEENKRNFSTPNCLGSKKTNSVINLNKLNLEGNTQTKNNIAPKYISSSILPQSSTNFDYFSPLPQIQIKSTNIII